MYGPALLMLAEDFQWNKLPEASLVVLSELSESVQYCRVPPP